MGGDQPNKGFEFVHLDLTLQLNKIHEVAMMQPSRVGTPEEGIVADYSYICTIVHLQRRGEQLSSSSKYGILGCSFQRKAYEPLTCRCYVHLWTPEFVLKCLFLYATIVGPRKDAVYVAG